MSRQDSFVARDANAPPGARMQYGALCWQRQDAGVEILLITSRDTGRWVIPKGWPMPGLAPEAAASQEAWEEAGVKGVVNPVCLGRYGYLKCLTPDASVPCAVAVYGLRVEDLAAKYPEMKARNRQWFDLTEAASLVDEGELRRLIEGFVPPPEGRPGPIGADDGGDGPRKRKPKSKR